MARRRIGAVVMAAALAMAPPARAEQGAPAEAAPGDRASTAAAKRFHPRKKRGQARAEEPRGAGDTVDRAQQWLQDHDILLGFDLAFYDQYASRVRTGEHNAATFNWQLFADYQLVDWKERGELHVTGTFLGTFGVDYDPASDPISQRVGAISVLNGNVYPDEFAVDELYLHYVADDADYVVALGRLDMSYFFDTNRVANDAYQQFTAYTFENDISIPFPTYGGFGAIGRWNPTDDIYVMLGTADASSDEREPFGRVGDGSWWQLLEAGVAVTPGGLGTGNYRLTGWHSDRGPGNGFGISLDLDQNLGADWLVAFLRAGTGDPAQTDVRAAVSGGLSFQGPFARKDDEAGIAASWADPSDGGRDETFFESYYRLALTEHLSISPGVQVVLHPSQNPDTDLSLVGGMRLLWML